MPPRSSRLLPLSIFGAALIACATWAFMGRYTVNLQAAAGGETVAVAFDKWTGETTIYFVGKLGSGTYTIGKGSYVRFFTNTTQPSRFDPSKPYEIEPSTESRFGAIPLEEPASQD